MKKKFEQMIFKRNPELDQYAAELEEILIQNGIDPEQAKDAARNGAMSITGNPDFSVEEIMLLRLNLQKRHWGLNASDEIISKAAKACGKHPRLIRLSTKHWRDDTPKSFNFAYLDQINSFLSFRNLKKYAFLLLLIDFAFFVISWYSFNS